MNRVLIGVDMGHYKIQQSVAVFMTLILKILCDCMPRQVCNDAWSQRM